MQNYLPPILDVNLFYFTKYIELKIALNLVFLQKTTTHALLLIRI